MEWGLKNGIDFSWQDIEDFGIHIGFLDSVRHRRFPGFLGTPRLESSDLFVGEKNGMWGMRSCPSFFLRPEDPKGSGSVLRGYAHLPGGGGPKSQLPKVQESEAGEAEVAGGQPFLHQEICVLRRPSVSGFDDHGCGEGTAPELENGEVAGKTIHAGTVEAGGIAWSEGDWHRRDLYPKRAHLSDCGQ